MRYEANDGSAPPRATDQHPQVQNKNEAMQIVSKSFFVVVVFFVIVLVVVVVFIDRSTPTQSR